MIDTAQATAAVDAGGNGQDQPDALIEQLIARHLEALALVRRHGGTKRNLTDLGNAERFVDAFGRDVLFDHSSGRWLLFDGRRFRPDETGAVYHLARAVTRGIYGEAMLSEEKARRKALCDWAKTSESAGKLRAMVDLARNDPAVAITHNHLDADLMLLNTESGTVDLRTGKLREHRREDRITKLCPVRFDSQAVPERWLQFLKEVTCGRNDLQDFLWRFFGYCLTGSTREQSFAVLWGAGKNGKTTLVNVIRGVLGDYCGEAPVETFMITRQDRGSASPDLARLRGLRLVTVRESESGQRLAESLINGLTGGDTIVARHLYCAPFEFQPTFKLVLFTNHRPRVRGTDLAIWRRIRLVPFEYRVPDEKVEPELDRRLLEEEGPGILRGLIEGCLDWQREGLPRSETVSKATSEYQEAEDALATFIVECCITNPAASARTSELYSRFRTWAERSGEYTLSIRRFSLQLEEKGYRKWPNTATYRGFNGIGLIPETDPGELFHRGDET